MIYAQTILPSLLHRDDIQESSIYHINTAYVSQEVIFVPVEQIMQPDMFRLLSIKAGLITNQHCHGCDDPHRTSPDYSKRPLGQAAVT